MNTLHNELKYLTQRSGMTHDRWRQAQCLRIEPRVFHASTKFAWLPDPVDPTGFRTRHIVVRDRGTYNIGRNKAKREQKRLQHALRAAR